jgi:radical SAM superfamily enzyme YgiQ (UPF0313 family)
MMIDCLLINSPDELLSNHLIADPKAPLGLLYIASYIRQHGATVKIIDCHSNQYSMADILGAVREFKPLLVGLNSSTPNRRIVFTLISKIKAIVPDCVVIVGGPHATCLPKDFFAHSPIDGVVLGEGEITTLKILEKLPILGSFDGFYLRADIENESILKISPRIQNLDDLPIPAYDLIDYDKYISVNPELYISSSRGCNHHCVFCSARSQLGHEVVFRSSSSVMDEIQQLRSTYNVERFYFYNENFSIWPDIEDFCYQAQRIKIRWSAQANINDLDSGIIPLLSASGCYALGIGFESGSLEMQKYIGKIINKDTTHKISLLEKSGVYPRGFFVIGFPNEDLHSILETARYLITLRLAGLKDVAIFPARPYPGTRLYQELIAVYGNQSQEEILDYQYLEDYKAEKNALIRLKLHRYNTVSSFRVSKIFSYNQIRRIIASLYMVFYNAHQYTSSTDDELYTILFSSVVDNDQ